MKMRASRNGAHVSGAERLLSEEELAENAGAMIRRALHHAKGDADFVQLKLERVREEEITYVEALPVRTVETATPAEGQAAILSVLRAAGIENGAAIMARFGETFAMRGAMLLDADTLERLEPDPARGIRATYMDAEHSPARSASAEKNHFQEAVVLASKVVSAPHIVAEICMSDDPGYVTGYVAAPAVGYVRITRLKEPGDPRGGRIFLYRGPRAAVAETIRYLEQERVLVRNVPSTPSADAPDADPWRSYRDDLAARKRAGLYRTMRRIDSPQCARVMAEGRERLMLASNSYLGLADEPRVLAAAAEALRRYGAGSGGSRLTTGNLTLHEALEAELARFKGTEDAILFNTGYMANVGVLSALGREGTVIFSDALNHASIIDGCRLSRARTIVYRHGDMEDLEEKVRAARPSYASGLIVTDAVFSMDGDLAPLPALLRIARRHGLLLMIDEAHATGVVGRTGRGLAEHFGLDEGPDIVMGTMSKALAAEGGFVCGSRFLIDYLRNAARSFIFSTSLAPATLAVAREALRILAAEPARVERLRANTRVFVEALTAHGIPAESGSAIVPILVGDETRALRIAQRLYDDGVFLSAIRYPTVAKGAARLRAALMATHTEEALRGAAEAIARAFRETDESQD